MPEKLLEKEERVKERKNEEREARRARESTRAINQEEIKSYYSESVAGLVSRESGLRYSQTTLNPTQCQRLGQKVPGHPRVSDPFLLT